MMKVNASYSLGVITVTYNARPFIEEFLECCLKQTHQNFKLLVVDNNSSDGTLELIQKYEDFRFDLILNKINVGYSAGCNQGIKYFKELGIEQLLFINNDTFFNEHLFTDLLDARFQYSADAITPRITYAQDLNKNWYAGGRINYWKGFQGEHIGEGKINDPADQTPKFTPVASGCCVLFSMAVFDQIGNFDEKFFVYGEDTDMFIRMSRNKKTLLYDPRISLAHKISLSTGGSQSNFSIHYYHRNQIYLIRKHLSIFWLPIQLIIILTKVVARFLLGMDSLRQSTLRIKGLIDGFKI